MSKRSDGFALLSMGLLFLTVPGILYNNLSASGLVNTSGAMTCSADPGIPTCVLSTTVGCQANPNNCLLSGQTISFFNTNSPFTQVLSGNLYGLFTNLNPFTSSGASQTSWSGTHGPFDITGNPLYYSSDCYGTNITASLSQTKWGIQTCTQTNTDNSNVTEGNTVRWNNWNTNWNTTVGLQFYHVSTGNFTFLMSCTWIAQINYTALANGPGYTYYGCTINQAPTVQFPPNNPTHRSWGLLFALPVTNGPMPGQAGVKKHVAFFAQLENWYSQTCLPGNNLGKFLSNQCTNFEQGFKGIVLPGTNVTFVPNSTGGIVFGFLAGIILLLGGLGLQVGVGGGVSGGINPQGTKLFQTLGLGLILWSFFSSQFATWYTSGILPVGLDGLLGILGLCIDALIFAGTYFIVVGGNAAVAD